MHLNIDVVERIYQVHRAFKEIENTMTVLTRYIFLQHSNLILTDKHYPQYYFKFNFKLFLKYIRILSINKILFFQLKLINMYNI